MKIHQTCKAKWGRLQIAQWKGKLITCRKAKSHNKPDSNPTVLWAGEARLTTPATITPNYKNRGVRVVPTQISNKSIGTHNNNNKDIGLIQDETGFHIPNNNPVMLGRCQLLTTTPGTFGPLIPVVEEGTQTFLTISI